MFNLGNFLSPLISGILADSYGYKSTTDIMMLSALGYSVILYLVLGTKRPY